MNKVLTIMLAGTMLSSVAHADTGVKEAEAYFGELLHKWETTSKSTWNGFNSTTEQNIVRDAAEAQNTYKNPNDGWCNEAVVWAMNNVGMFEDNVFKTPEWGNNTMRGRDFTSHYNNKVESHYNHNDTFSWDDVPIGAVALLNTNGSPNKTWGDLGINHTTTFMGVIEGTDYGWFLGGNQSGRLQPKMYRLADMTYASTFNDDDADVNKHVYHNIEEYAEIDLEDGSWTIIHSPTGWGWGTNKAPKARW